MSEFRRRLMMSASGGEAVPVFYDYALFNSAYIDTGVKVSANVAVELKAMSTNQNSAVFMSFGYRGSTSTNNRQQLYASQAVYNYMSGNTSITAKTNTMFVVKVDVKNKRWSIERDGVVTTDTTYSVTAPSSTATANNLWYGKANPNSMQVYNQAKQYGCKIWLNDVLVRDFRPCKFGSQRGFYDVVNEEFYAPAAGTITLGND